MWDVLGLAVPGSFRMILVLGNEVTNLVILGQSSTDPAVTAAVGLGNMMQNVFGLSIGFGLISAFDTLVSQAHGAQDEAQCIVLFARGRAIATAQLLWIIPLLCNTEALLLLFGQDPDVARYASEYNRAACFGLWQCFMFEATQSYLKNRNFAISPLVATAVSSILHVGWCYYFVHVQGLGNWGAGLANSVTWTTELVVLASYLLWVSPGERKQLIAFSRPAFQKWREFLAVGLPAMVQMCGEWWFWEITALIVGNLHSAEALAAHVSTANYAAVAFMPAIGTGGAAAALVGHAVGREDAVGAKRVMVVSVCLCVGVMGIISLTTWFCSQQIAAIYQKAGSLQDLTAHLLRIYFTLVCLLDAIQTTLGASLRGMGKQNTAAWIYLLAFYGVMMPTGIAFAFPAHFGVQGIYYGMCVGMVLAVALFGLVVRRLRFADIFAQTDAHREKSLPLVSSSCETTA